MISSKIPLKPSLKCLGVDLFGTDLLHQKVTYSLANCVGESENQEETHSHETYWG